jgi:hypothetical protein
MEREQEYARELGKRSMTIAIILLNVASIILLFSSIFIIQILSIAYGTGAGALIQSKQDNMSVAPILQPSVANLAHIYSSIAEAYILLIIALISEGIGFAFVVNERSKSKKYIAMHASLVLIFVLLYYIILSSLSIANISLYINIASVAIVLSFAVDAYLAYAFSSIKRKQPRKTNISINPSTPFGNALELQEKLFSQLGGNLRIVDKHFNSNSLSNLYRLVSPYLKNLTAIRIITSKEMLDKNFAVNYNDLKAELAKSNVEIELRIMSDEAAKEQHERFMFDSENAYKIPPINIITRKSEHIVRMSLADAKKRYEELYRNSVKFENFYSIANNEAK